MPNTRCINFGTSSSIGINRYIHNLCLILNIKIKGKGKIAAYGFSNPGVFAIGNWFVAVISVSFIGNRFFEASWTKRNDILVGFDHDPFIINKFTATIIELSYGVIINYLNNNLIPHRGNNFLLSISHACNFLELSMMLIRILLERYIFMPDTG